MLNVLRLQNLDYIVPMRTKSKLVKKIQTIFTDKQYAQEVDQLNFDSIAKILSDAVHFGNVGIVGNKLEDLLTKKEGL